MELTTHFSVDHSRSAIFAFLIVSTAVLLPAQQNGAGNISQSDFEYLNRPIVTDWSTRHVVFSNPGTLEDAQRNGKEQEWRHIVTDPRYRMQWIRRYSASAASKVAYVPDRSSLPGYERHNEADRSRENDRDRGHGRDEGRDRDRDRDRNRDRGRGKQSESDEKVVIRGDWSVPVGASGASVAADTYPAKFTFSAFNAPDCTVDFVVYPVASASTGTSANIVGVNNLYSGTCSGTVPNVLFAYNVGTGSIQTSPVLSPDGTKVAFIESRTSGASIFHVLTLDKRGNAGCATSTSPCNGTAYNSAAVPGTNNTAVDTKVTLNLNGSTNGPITRSSPFIDYTNDIAYVGDDNGNLHKITNVFGLFGGTPTEVVSSGYWPACVGTFSSSCSFTPILSSPVVDGCSTNGGGTPAPTCPGGASGSGLMIIGASNGTLFGDPTGYGGYSGISGLGGYNFASKTVTVGTSILDAPILDGTTEQVFIAASNGSNMILGQVKVSPTASASTSGTPFPNSPITVTTGINGTDAYDGALDNAYYSSAARTGFMYFCGNATGTATPALWRVGISNGTMSTTVVSNVFQLVSGTNAGTSYDCTPLTEFYNSTQGVDYLFVGVKNSGAPAGCSNSTCLMSFSLPMGYGTPATSVAIPTLAAATPIPAGTAGAATNGASGIVIDNTSGLTGTSQIYFGNPFAGAGIQMSQSTLQ